jgi:hypothetical protein
MTLSKLAPLTQTEIAEMAADWYRKLDVHAPLEEVFTFLAEDGLEMRLPEVTLTGFDGFTDWYERVVRVFFDEVHTVKEVNAIISDDTASVKVVVNWQASVWKPPAANSERIMLNAYQTWIVKRSLNTGKPVIQTYIVDSLDYQEGSAQL